MTEEEILLELARLHQAVEEKVRRRQRGELFDRVAACVENGVTVQSRTLQKEI